MAKVGLDAICAKLSRNAEISSREVDTGSPSNHDNTIDNGASPDETSVMDERRLATSSGPALPPTSESLDLSKHESATVAGNGTFTSKPVDRASSITDSGFGEEVVLNGDGAEEGVVADAGRRSRRKNFLPRCVQDGQVITEHRPTADAAAASTTATWSVAVENVDGDQTVLDLRTGPSSSAPTRQTGDWPASLVRRSGDDAQDQVLDLSVSRSGRGLPGDDVLRDAGERTTIDRASTAEAGDVVGGLNVTDLRVYAANTMNELLHIYGLPDDHQSAATDLRKWCSPDDDRGSGTGGTPALSGVDLRPAPRFDSNCSSSGIRDRKPDTTMSFSSGQMSKRVIVHTTELSREKGTFNSKTPTDF